MHNDDLAIKEMLRVTYPLEQGHYIKFIQKTQLNPQKT